jgi:hypothetical protein
MKKFLLLSIVSAALAASASENPFTALPASGQTVSILKDGNSYLDFTIIAWGPKWSQSSFKGTAVGSKGIMSAANSTKIGDANIALDVQARQMDASQLELNYELKSSQKTAVTLITAGINFDEVAFAGGKTAIKTDGGETATANLPLGKTGLGKRVKVLTLTDAGGFETRLEFDPPCDIASDKQGRIVLAENELAKTVKQAVTVSLPGDVTFYASAAEVPADPGSESWYTFSPANDASKPSEIGMQDWLEKPAGKHGRITRDGGKLMYNGKPIKLWGLNDCYSACAPEKTLANKRAALYAKYGINAVRLHKYADGPGWSGIQADDSFLKFNPAALDLMDYFVSRLKEQGIYVTLSSTFGVKLGPADREYVPYMDEFGTAKGGGKNRLETGHSSIFLSRELQDMQIAQVVQLLKHKNPHTGLTYAEDPAVAVVELINEESILFYNTHSVLQKIPTLRKRAGEAFCDWLQNRYGSEEALLAAWEPEALNCFASDGFAGESLKEKTIVPAGNPWYFDPDQLEGSHQSKKARFLDTMLFLYELQNDFYNRYVQAIRDTGYTGEILASNWQAGRAFSHYYNLHSDALVGLIDRHNYFGGGKGSKIENGSMLASPGSAMLSVGMQQVDDRPFMLSEWIHVAPNEWGVEGPAIIGAYGMGLQDWDASLIFQNKDDGGFNKQIDDSGWAVTAPQILGIFPAVSRQVLRGDVKEADITATRYVHVPSLHEGKIGFNDQVVQEGDEKTFTSDKVPSQAMAAARCVIDFTDNYQDTPAFDLAPYLKNGGVQSSTGELFWQEGKSKLDGYFTINAPATRAVVGFAQGQKCVLGDVTIEPESRFGAIYVTAQKKDKDISTSKNLLITAIARARNTGMKVLNDSVLLEKGSAPVVMEPVKARITVGRKVSNVYLLNHDGIRTEKTLPVKDGSFEIDGARDKTCYYLVTVN